jgi:hypothetical protein
MSREGSDEFEQKLEALESREPFVAPAIRRAMELRLFRNVGSDIAEDDNQLPDFETDEERVVYVLDILKNAIEESEEIWDEFDIHRDPDDAMKALEEGKELRSMVEAYLTLPDDDNELLDRQESEILQQKITFADAVIELWIRDHMDILYRDALAEKIRRVLGGQAVRLTPLTKDAVKEWLDADTPPDELFCDGYIASISAGEGVASVSMGFEADGTDPVTGDIPVWRQDRRTGEMVQEAKIELVKD